VPRVAGWLGGWLAWCQWLASVQCQCGVHLVLLAACVPVCLPLWVGVAALLQRCS
jgi:hypothetical protein